MAQTIILRFSDFDRPTIAEHQYIIDLHKEAWWGWWKKTTEEDQRDRLEQLANECPLEIGLLDRREWRYYIANLGKIVVPPTGVTCGSPLPEYTPEYYRDEQHPAWFLLSSIKAVSRDDFERQFGGTPMGEPTIFFVEYVGRKAVLDETAKSTLEHREFNVNGNSILHISDLHFGEGHGFQPFETSFGERRLEDKIVECVKKLEETDSTRIGLVIISGDIITKSDNLDFIAAKAFLEKLVELLSIDKNQCVITPGNHDIPLGLESRPGRTYSHEDPFRMFLESFYFKKCRRLERLYTYKFKDPSFIFNVLALNSSRLRKVDLSDYGYIGDHRYLDYLDEIERRNSGYDTVQLTQKGIFNAAVLHHHLIPVEHVSIPERERSVSVTLDAGQIMSNFLRAKMHLVFHGHRHMPFVGRVSRAYKTFKGEWTGLDQNMWIVASGSTGGGETILPKAMRNNTLSVYTPDEGALKIRIFEFNPVQSATLYLEQVISW